MVIKWVTCKPVIARIIRNMRSLSADYMNDLPEWIAEAVVKTKTYNSVVLKEYCEKVEFHMVEIPCTEDTIAAVVLNGERLLPSGSDGPMIPMNGSEGSTIFQSIVRLPNGVQDIEETDINNYPYYLSTIGSLQNCKINHRDTYRVRYNKLELTAEKGNVKLYFWSIPTDEDGLPMVPDHEDLQTAIYWYCRMMAIGAGFADPTFRYGDCESRWESYAARAMNDITYPSPDEKMRNIINNVSLIPNQNFWANFGTSNLQPDFDSL